MNNIEMKYNFNLEYFEKSADYVKSKIDFKPQTALILGSALGSLASDIKNPVEIPYKDIPDFLVSTVKSHAGKLILGELYGRKVVCMSGRFHYYEGYDYEQLVAPVRLFKLLGVENMILTNAAGGINTGYKPGDLMIIRDHINLAGASPLRGPNDDRIGPRFFDVCNAYDEGLRTLAKSLAKECSLRIQEGVYAYQTGPHFETPAEIRFLRMAGADAAGMSTVTEALTAAHCGLKTLAISLISNMAAGVNNNRVDGEEVDYVAAQSAKEFKKYLSSILAHMESQEDE